VFGNPPRLIPISHSVWCFADSGVIHLLGFPLHSETTAIATKETCVTLRSSYSPKPKILLTRAICACQREFYLQQKTKCFLSLSLSCLFPRFTCWCLMVWFLFDSSHQRQKNWQTWVFGSCLMA